MPVLTINPLRLQTLLHQLFRQQATDALRRISLDDLKPPDMAHWNKVTAEAVKPLLLQHFQAGIVQSRRRLAALLAGRKPSAEPRRVELYPEHTFAPHRRKAAGFYVRKAARLGMDFDLFSPRVLDAVDAAAFEFCRETNDTATSDLMTALRKLRKLMKRGLGRGDAVSYLARQVRRIFADPSRAFRIAASESSRAMHAGALMNAKENPAVKKVEWLASADACSACLELDGRQVDLGVSFADDGKGGPYSKTFHPPLHPHCMCDFTEVI